MVFVLVFFGLLWLGRNQERFGAGKGYAVDPVCGGQVQTANAPVMVSHAGHGYFCSDRCRARFMQDPERFTNPGAESEGMQI